MILSKNQYTKTIISIAAGAFLYGLSVGMDFVIIPLMFESSKLDNTMIGILLAAEFSATLATAPFLHRIAAHLGIKKMLLYSILLRNFVILILPLYHNQYYWLVAMFLCGLGGFTLFTIMQLWINHICTNANRGISIGVLTASFSCGIALGPFILNHTTLEGVVPFLFSGILGLLALAPLSLNFATLPQYVMSVSSKNHLIQIIRTSPVPIISGILVDFIFFTLSSFLVLYGISYGLSKEDASFLITAMLVGGIVLDIPVGWLADRINRKLMMLCCAMIIILCSELLSSVITNHYLSTILFAIWLGATGGIYTCSLALLGDYFKGEQLMVANSAFSMMSCCGGISGIVLTGVITDLIGADGMTITITAITVIYLATTGYMYWQNKNANAAL